MLNPFVLQLVAGLLLAPAASPPRSLADVARMEEARRQALKTTGKLYTAADLRSYVIRERASVPSTQPPVQVPEPGRDPFSGTAAAPVTAPAAAPAEPPRPEEPVKDEAWWRTRITDARTRLERSRIFLDALQSRANALTNDFYARDDPAQRAVIEQERNRALAEMERIKQEIEEQAQAITDIEEEARREGIPPGWLR